MNERIIELAVEANDQTGNKFDLNYKELDSFLEKFAELIVRECLSYMKDGDIDFAKFMIKKHFGVEE